ncbi:hypothetical protein ZWY2020_057923 [Hordeum vulgare]|nr:hypothetical protein ZWY2020_057923 [Hordeum vulgare]
MHLSFFCTVLTVALCMYLSCKIWLDSLHAKKDKYNNEDPSPIEFFKETHTKRKTGSMNEQPMSIQIVAGVLKEHSSSSTFLSTMGYQSRSGRSRTSAS